MTASTAQPRGSISTSTRLKLSLMMFLEFFIWGAWLPLIFGYLPSLGFSNLQQSLILNTFPLAAIVAMFFSNQFADRNFAAERFLAFSHLVGGLSILALGWVTSFWPFFFLMVVHCFFYVPTISITNFIRATSSFLIDCCRRRAMRSRCVRSTSANLQTTRVTSRCTDVAMLITARTRFSCGTGVRMDGST